MSIIKCPECKRKVSDKASICPKCGFSVKDYQPNQEQIEEQNKKSKDKKRRVIKGLIISVSIIMSICIIGCVVSIGVEMYDDYQIEKEEQEYKSKYPLFSEHSYILGTDPYGLTNENNIIGEKISTVLGKCVENEDYTISIEKDNTLYTFPLPPFDDYPIGHDVELVLYTSNGAISKVEYTFRMEQSVKEGYTFYRKTKEIKAGLTGYYDVDPIYAGYNYIDNEYVIMTKDEFNSLSDSDYFDVTFITWESEKGIAMLSFTNMFDEKDEYGAITFINGKIKKGKYKDYIDKYNPAI